MQTNDIVAAIDAEILRLQQAKAILNKITPAKRRVGRPARVSSPSKATSFDPAQFEKKPAKRRTMSAEGRARIAAAQKLRWAAQKKADKKAASPAPKKRAAKATPRKGASKKAVPAKKAAQTTAATNPASAS